MADRKEKAKAALGSVDEQAALDALSANIASGAASIYGDTGQALADMLNPMSRFTSAKESVAPNAIANVPSAPLAPMAADVQALDTSQIPQPGQDVSIGASFTPAPLRAPTISTAPLREQRAKIGAAGKAGGLARAGALGEQKSALGEQAKAATDLANAQARSVETVAGALESRNARIADAEGMAIRREQAARQNVQDRVAGWRNARAERDAMKIDPDAWYRDKHGSTTGRRIGAAVSVAFGAIGQAFSGGPNTALRIIEGSIDRNLASQRAKMLTADKSVAGAKEDVTSARQHFSDTAAINAAERAEIMADAAAQIEALTLRAKTPEIQAKGQQLVAELRGKSSDLEAQAAETEFGAEMRTLTAEGGVLGQEMAIKSKNAQAVFDAKKATIAMQSKAAAGPGGVVAPPGLRVNQEAIKSGYVPGKEDFKKAKDLSAKFHRVDGLFQKFIGWRKEHGAEVPGRARAVGDRIAKDLIIELKVLKEMGANFTEMEKELLGVPEDAGEIGFVLDRMNTMRQNMTEGTAQSLRPYGFEIDNDTSRGGRKL